MKVPVFGNAILHRAITEVRYNLGHLYWDNCGATINAITEALEGWEFGAIESGFCRMCCRALNMTYNFGWQRLDLGQIQTVDHPGLEGLVQFLEPLPELARLTVDLLGLHEFTRVGLRTWHLFDVGSVEQGEQKLERLQWCKSQNPVPNATDGVKERRFSILLGKGERRVRISLSTARQQVTVEEQRSQAALSGTHKLPPGSRKPALVARGKALKKSSLLPEHVLLVDIDWSEENPVELTGEKIREFASESYEATCSMLPKVLALK